jgi:hypothetical protein
MMSISKLDKPAIILIEIQKVIDNAGYWGAEEIIPM